MHAGIDLGIDLGIDDNIGRQTGISSSKEYGRRMMTW